jgi:hypothetical protein
MNNLILACKKNMVSRNQNGFAIMFALIIGTILLILAVSLYSFMGHQHNSIQNIVNGEIAHFLAEAGISSCIGAVRDAITTDFSSSGQQSEIQKLLMQRGGIEDREINDLLGDTWNKELQKFAREVDKKYASIRVDVWLRKFRMSETSSAQWNDPVSKEGELVIESVARYKGSQRVLSVRRELKIASILPGPLSKFTFFVENASRNGEASFNLIRNDYRGTVTDGPKPLICYNHATPETPLETGSIGDILKKEKESEVYKNRGWIYLGPTKIRLQLSSGAGELGEIFHFYDVSNSFDFSPVKFVTPVDRLPEKMRSTIQLPWDKSEQTIRNVSYNFSHGFVIDGFHDRSNRKSSDAMYEGDILSEGERQFYSSKSSVLHLFGDARKGYQSRTRVLGPVTAAFPRFASLEITPEEPDVKNMFNSLSPPPLYLVPSKSQTNYTNSVVINEVLNRRCGGPILRSGMICKDYSEYSSIMSRVTELPYALSYNSMQDVYTGKTQRVFPSDTQILGQNSGNEIVLADSEGHEFFKGRVRPKFVAQQLTRRTQIEVDEISDFWERFTNKNDELELNQIVKIKNTKGLDLVFPPSGKPIPLKIKGGGMIILGQGNLVLRGLVCEKAGEALTLVALKASSVSFSSVQPNHVNIVAPSAELSYGSRLNIYGTLCVSSVFADQRFQGGALRYRNAIDPTDARYFKFYKPHLSEVDSYWNE